MSRIRAVTARIETIIEAATPETPLSAARFRKVSGAPQALQLRQFAVAPTGSVRWFDTFPQSSPGSMVAEGFEVVVGYAAAHPDRSMRDVIREDVLMLQHELMHPDNWDDGDATRSEIREVGDYRVEYTTENEQLAGLEVTIPLTVRYRPF